VMARIVVHRAAFGSRRRAFPVARGRLRVEVTLSACRTAWPTRCPSCC